MLNRKCTICSTSKPLWAIRSPCWTSFSPISTDWLCFQHTQTPRTQDLVIFVPITTTDGQTDCFTPCACARGNYCWIYATRSWVNLHWLHYALNCLARLASIAAFLLVMATSMDSTHYMPCTAHVHVDNLAYYVSKGCQLEAHSIHRHMGTQMQHALVYMCSRGL